MPNAPNIVDLLLTPNSTRPGGNRPGTPLSPQGVTVHRTGDPGATARNIRNYFDTIRPGNESSAHYVVDGTGEIIRCIPETEVAWHAGPAANQRDIGIETCEPLTGAAYESTVWLVADIHRRMGWQASLGLTIRPHSFYSPTDRPEDPFSWIRYQAGQSDSGALYLPAPFLATVEASLMPFKDVPSSHWAAVAIELVANKGLMQGYADGTFRPDNPISRAELAVVLQRLLVLLKQA